MANYYLTEKEYVRNNSDCHFDFAATRGIAYMASQSTVGLLPEWRSWSYPIDSDNSAAVGKDLRGALH